MEKWTKNKYKVVVNSLKVKMKQEGKQYEADALDMATDYLIEHPDLADFIEKFMYFDSVRKLAEDIGYIRGQDRARNEIRYERFSYGEEDKVEVIAVPSCAYCGHVLPEGKCKVLGERPKEVIDCKVKCDKFKHYKGE